MTMAHFTLWMNFLYGFDIGPRQHRFSQRKYPALKKQGIIRKAILANNF
jgi:hypothetical protein